jgi:phage recombination protein Bet
LIYSSGNASEPSSTHSTGRYTRNSEPIADREHVRMSVQATIDGFRVVAERSGKYVGQDGPYWCGPDAKWLDVWLAEDAPAAAKIGVWKSGAKAPTYGVATFKEYAQRGKQGQLTGLWGKMPSNQLAKCAEALALRKAFPNELSGIYTTEEMAQADNPIDGDASDITGATGAPGRDEFQAARDPETGRDCQSVADAAGADADTGAGAATQLSGRRDRRGD